MNTLHQLHIDDNGVAFHESFGTSYQINDSAIEIIDKLKEGLSVSEIIDSLSHEYGISKEMLFIDVQDFISKLTLYGVL